MKQVVCRASELAPGQVVSTKLGPMPVVVARAPDGSLYGMLDKCLHQGGPLSRGKLMDATDADPGQVGRYRDDNGRVILKCPWHGYEYDIRTGATLFDEN